jgi:hypothetical protein
MSNIGFWILLFLSIGISVGIDYLLRYASPPVESFLTKRLNIRYVILILWIFNFLLLFIPYGVIYQIFQVSNNLTEINKKFSPTFSSIIVSLFYLSNLIRIIYYISHKELEFKPSIKGTLWGLVGHLIWIFWFTIGSGFLFAIYK